MVEWQPVYGEFLSQYFFRGRSEWVSVGYRAAPWGVGVMGEWRDPDGFAIETFEGPAEAGYWGASKRVSV